MRRALYVTLMVMAAGGLLAAEPKPDCCFTNSAYSGVCRVTPGADETCKSILEYLNTTNSAGKAYCGGTQVRGGWEEVRCREAPEPKASNASEDAASPPRGEPSKSTAAISGASAAR